MAVLQSMTRGAVEAAAKIAKPVLTAIGVDQKPAGEAAVDRLTQLKSVADTAAQAVQAAREDLELAYFELEEGAPDRVPAAEEALRAADQAFDRAHRGLDAHKAVLSRKATADSTKARRAAWDNAMALAEARKVAADRLRACLREAGEHYADVVRLGLETHSAIPSDARWPGGPVSYRLDVMGTGHVVGLDLHRAGLPQVLQVSPSLFDQHPSIADVAASNLDMVRQQRDLEAAA